LSIPPVGACTFPPWVFFVSDLGPTPPFELFVAVPFFAVMIFPTNVGAFWFSFSPVCLSVVQTFFYSVKGLRPPLTLGSQSLSVVHLLIQKPISKVLSLQFSPFPPLQNAVGTFLPVIPPPPEWPFHARRPEVISVICNVRAPFPTPSLVSILVFANSALEAVSFSFFLFPPCAHSFYPFPTRQALSPEDQRRFIFLGEFSTLRPPP